MEKTRLYKLVQHLQMESVFQKKETRDKSIDAALAIAQHIPPNSEMNWEGVNHSYQETGVLQLVHRFGSEHTGVQDWAGTVIHGRDTGYVSVPHSKPIKDFAKPVEPRNPPQKRSELAEQYGFRFDNFSQLLKAIGFWQRIGPLLENIPEDAGGVKPGSVDWEHYEFAVSDPRFKAVMNVINGSAQIDYEKAFPELEESFDLIKQHKFHTDAYKTKYYQAKGKSPLSVPDILSALVIEKLNSEAGFSEEQKSEIRYLNALILDDQVPNSKRVQLYEKLKTIYKDLPKTELVRLVGKTASDLAIPDDRSDKIARLEDVSIKMPTVDAVVPLGSSDDGYHAYIARQIVNRNKDAAMIPSGGRAPHELLTGNVSQFTEADLMVAMALCNNLDEIYRWKPQGVQLNEPPLNQYDIFAPDDLSYSTETNAQKSILRINALQNLVGSDRPLQILVVTNNLHSSRAGIDFRNALKGHALAQVSVFENSESPHLKDMHTERKIHGLTYMFGEYAKHLYMVS